MEDDDLVVEMPDGAEGVITSLYDDAGTPIGDDQMAEAHSAVVFTPKGEWIGCLVSDLTMVEADDA